MRDALSILIHFNLFNILARAVLLYYMYCSFLILFLFDSGSRSLTRASQSARAYRAHPIVFELSSPSFRIYFILISGAPALLPPRPSARAYRARFIVSEYPPFGSDYI
jgi:hypothetical protein